MTFDRKRKKKKNTCRTIFEVRSILLLSLLFLLFLEHHSRFVIAGTKRGERGHKVNSCVQFFEGKTLIEEMIPPPSTIRRVCPCDRMMNVSNCFIILQSE